jgi:hypothetical protein
LEQLDRYLSRLGLDSGTLVIFDRRHDTVRDAPQNLSLREQQRRMVPAKSPR